MGLPPLGWQLQKTTMNLAKKGTQKQSTPLPVLYPKKAQNAPPPSVSASLTKGKGTTIPCNIYPGESVKIQSERIDRQKYNGNIGTVLAVIYPGDRTRSIIYVAVNDRQPCFWYSEIVRVPKAVQLPQPETEEVQPCE